jgi:general secretion pathway protein K
MRVLRQEKGMVLLLVLVVVALLSALLTEWAFSTHVDMRLTETFRDSTRAWYLAKGGVQAGRMILQNDTNAWDHPSELWGQGIPAYPVGDNGSVSIAIEDLAGKLNVNNLIRQGKNLNGPLAQVLVQLFNDLDIGDSDDLVASLVDWIDTDTTTTQPGGTLGGTGAETGYYQGLASPYTAKDEPLDSLEELKMIRGFTPEVFLKVKDFLTVHGSTAVNLNTAAPRVIQSLRALDPTVDAADLDRVVQFRDAEPIKERSELAQMLGVQSDAYRVLSSSQEVPIAFKGDFFRIVATGEIGDEGGRRTVIAIVDHGGKNIYYMKVD